MMSVENVTVVVSPSVFNPRIFVFGSTPELSAKLFSISEADGTVASACTADTWSVTLARSKPNSSPCSST